LREKLNEMDFLRSRVNVSFFKTRQGLFVKELREENSLAQESLLVLEEQLAAAQRRIAQHAEVDQRLVDTLNSLTSTQSEMQKVGTVR
jgi:hypothetical protein